MCSCKHVCGCIRGKKFGYNENVKFQYILSTPIGRTEYGGKWLYQVGYFTIYLPFPIAKERGNYILTTSVSIKWTVADASKPLLRMYAPEFQSIYDLK